MLPSGGQGSKAVPGNPVTYTSAFDVQGTYAYILPYMEFPQINDLMNMTYAYNDKRRSEQPGRRQDPALDVALSFERIIRARPAGLRPG